MYNAVDELAVVVLAVLLVGIFVGAVGYMLVRSALLQNKSVKKINTALTIEELVQQSGNEITIVRIVRFFGEDYNIPVSDTLTVTWDEGAEAQYLYLEHKAFGKDKLCIPSGKVENRLYDFNYATVA